MARPTNADAEATRSRILDVACELLAERSPSDFSNREVARRAAVSVSMVNHHFGSKRELIHSCLETMYEGIDVIGAKLVSAMGDGTPLSILFDRAIINGYRHVRKYQAFVRILMVGVINDGDLDSVPRPTFDHPGLSQVMTLLATSLGLTPLEVKLRLKSFLFVISRYAAGSEASLEHLCEGASSTQSAIEDHLLGLARLMFPLPRPDH